MTFIEVRSDDQHAALQILAAAGLQCRAKARAERRATPRLQEVLIPGSIFTEREMQVLTFITDGLTPKQIATLLNLSSSMVTKYRTRAFRKIGVENSEQAVVYAFRNNLVRINGVAR